jgi:hypothetical protein
VTEVFTYHFAVKIQFARNVHRNLCDAPHFVSFVADIKDFQMAEFCTQTKIPSIYIQLNTGMKKKSKLKLSLQKQELCLGFAFFYIGIGIPGKIWTHQRLPKSTSFFAKS